MTEHRDWKIIFISFAALVLLVMVAGGYMLYRLQTGTLFAAPPEVSDNEIIGQKKVVKIMNDTFDKKAAEYEAFQMIVPAEADPSL